MTLNQLLKEHLTMYQISKFYKLGINTPHNWKRRGYIPYPTQLKIEMMSGGKFKATKPKGIIKNERPTAKD